VIPDVNRHPLFEDWKWGGAIVGLPLYIGERVIGVMNIAFEEPRAFDENLLRLLELLAAQAAIAIHNARLYRQVQQHASELELRVEERTAELTAAYERLRELDQLKSRFINDISHELRTPATNIRLYLELLERGNPEKRAQYSDVIKDQTDQMVRLVEDILHFSRLELDKTRIAFSSVDLNAAAGQAVDAHHMRAEAANLQLVFEPDATLPTISGEHSQLVQMINILLDNAINFTSAGFVRVATCLARDPRQVCLQVIDTGSGIEPDDLPHIFDRFYRGRGVGSSNIPGTGLGLSLAQEIVSLHGGRIEVESQVGTGSTFRVFFPLEEGKNEQPTGDPARRRVSDA
jgi:signal transduction histidine kinase